MNVLNQATRRMGLVAFFAWAAVALAPVAWAQAPAPANPTEVPAGPVVLRNSWSWDPSVPGNAVPGQPPATAPNAGRLVLVPQGSPTPALYQPTEFERYVQGLERGRSVERARDPADPTPPQEAPLIRRYGWSLMTPEPGEELGEGSPLPPPDYLIKPGDELTVSIWGAVDADLRLKVDRSGRVTLPRVGAVPVAGRRFSELQPLLTARVAQVFRNFELAVSLGELKGMRVYVSGFVARPGSLKVNSLTTVVQALMQAGGPSPAGSFRAIEVRRAGRSVARLDLYDLLLRGERTADLLLQPDDVIFVGPVGAQVAVVGSVNNPGIFELDGKDRVQDVLRMAGGFSAIADRSRLSVERLEERSTGRVVQWSLPQDAGRALSHGDVIRAFSAVQALLPIQLQNKRVIVEGEVMRPGEYVVRADTTLAQALELAGGLTASAFPFGTELLRESTRITQATNYDRALRELETDLARSVSGQRTVGSEDAAAQRSRETANARLIASMRSLRPNGRIVLSISPETQQLPDLMLEDRDRLYVPPRPSSVGVFGSVYNGGNFLYRPSTDLNTYLQLAGGSTKGADARSAFVVRADGSVISGRQRGGFFGSSESAFGALPAQPGDTIFVPEEMDKTTFMQHAKDWTQILSQFGLGAAAIKTLRN